MAIYSRQLITSLVAIGLAVAASGMWALSRFGGPHSPGETLLGSTVMVVGLCLLAWGSAYYAKNKGYSYVWGLICFFFPWGLPLLWLVPDRRRDSPSA